MLIVLSCLVLVPALVLAIGFAANVMRTTRSAAVEVADADFVRTARGKGVPAGRIRSRHILRNASVPIVTITGIQFGYLLGGTVIIEQIFALPGLGRLLFTSIENRDYPLVRFGTGDLSAVLPGPSPCGRTNTRIKGWMGRADQSTKVRALFVTAKQVNEILRRHPEVLRARLVVEGEVGKDRMTLRCEAKERPAGLAEAIKKAVIASPAFWLLIEENAGAILARDPAALERLGECAAAVQHALTLPGPSVTRGPRACTFWRDRPINWYSSLRGPEAVARSESRAGLCAPPAGDRTCRPAIVRIWLDGGGEGRCPLSLVVSSCVGRHEPAWPWASAHT